jgi:D-3-phosphoglycerate dehydrogenase
VTEDETVAAVAGARVVFVNFAPITRRALAELAPGASVIRYGVGYDNVDVTAAQALGVQVANIPDYGVGTVADHAAASLLALARRLSSYDTLIRTHGWARPGDVGPLRGLATMVVGLVGFGRIAQAVAQRMTPFGCTLIAHDPYCPPETMAALAVEPVTLDMLASRSHAVSLHAPATDGTRKLVDAAFLGALPRGAILVNTARGGLVDEAALAAALSDGRLAAAALDVTDPEPWARDSPLRTAPNLLLSPHAAFYADDSLDSLQQLASDEAGRALRGEPLRCPITAIAHDGAPS